MLGLLPQNTTTSILQALTTSIKKTCGHIQIILVTRVNQQWSPQCMASMVTVLQLTTALVLVSLQATDVFAHETETTVTLHHTPTDITILRGRDGHDGEPGKVGPRGLPGANGAPGLRGPPGPDNEEVVYTRWGKRTCRSGANLVYTGIMAGSHHQHRGGGTTRLCMPLDPQYTLQFIDGVQSYSPLYPVEYQNTVRGTGLDIPCAVCIAPRKHLVLMIPAKTSCPASFTREYYGYLMSERDHPNHHRSTFECVDKDLEAVPGSSRQLGTGWFGHTEAVCNALPCPPYNNHKEITCVVCSK